MAAGAAPRALDYGPFLSSRGVGFLHGRATAMDPAARRITVAAADGGTREITYDWLVFALGSATDRDSVPGVAEHAFTLDTIESARRVHGAAAEAAASRGGRWSSAAG